VEGSCEHGNEPSGSIKCWKIFEWVDNIKIDLREIGWDGIDWINLEEDRDQRRALVNMIMNLRVP
jgi:hypothetical protein